MNRKNVREPYRRGGGGERLLLFLLLLFGTLISRATCGKSDDKKDEALRKHEIVLTHVKPSATPKEQEEAVKALAGRLLNNRSAEFEFEVNPDIGPKYKDTFKVLSSGLDGTIVKVTGTSGVAAAWGLLHYIKYQCNGHISWEADQLSLPSPLPQADISVTSNDRFRYYQNVCTVSYSMAWWQWERWEREIDWMALNGINMPLAFTAQEAIWNRVYKKFGLNQQDLDSHFVGPAFFAWGRMGNINGWGGPLSESWHNQTLALQHQILDRMRSLGITPVLPAFAGHVPAALQKHYPEANITRLQGWAGFDCTYSCTYLLDPNDELFKKIGTEFIKEYSAEFGTDHLYNCDTFNEMTPKSDDPTYLKNTGTAIFEAMQDADKDAIWVMQGWLFFNAADFWQAPQAKALLTSVPIGRMIVLDLASEISPQYERLESYFGQPFIFNMLHNYGGVDGLFGNADILVKNMEDARNFPNVTLIGTGLTPEGINQNYVMYDFMNEFAWRTSAPDLNSWASSYAVRRYGSTDPRLQKAWTLLMNSVYFNATFKNHGNYVMMRRPDIHRDSDTIWYPVQDLVQAWDLIVDLLEDIDNKNPCPIISRHQHDDGVDNSIDNANDEVNLQQNPNEQDICQSIRKLRDNPGFLHDVVDITRQMLQIYVGETALTMFDYYHDRNLTGVTKERQNLAKILQDLDDILATSPDFLLGAWTEGAAEWATNDEERDLYILNALNQVTLWGPNGEIHDYAVKQWSGVISHYIAPRWDAMAAKLEDCLKTGKPFWQIVFNKEVFEQVEEPMSKNVTVSYPSEPTGDTIALALAIHKKYRPFFDDLQPKIVNEEIDEGYPLGEEKPKKPNKKPTSKTKKHSARISRQYDGYLAEDKNRKHENSVWYTY